MAGKMKSPAPKRQTQPSTVPSKAEMKTSRPVKGRGLATPMMPPPGRPKKGPRY